MAGSQTEQGSLSWLFTEVAICLVLHVALSTFHLEPVLDAFGEDIGAALGITPV